MIGHVLRHDEELHHTIIESAIQGRKPSGRPRNSYKSQLKKDGVIHTFVRLKKFGDDRVKWRTKLNIVNQPNTR